MSTTSESLEEIAARHEFTSSLHSNPDLIDMELKAAETIRAAAARLDELERENARMREALFETHLDLVAYADIDVARKRLVKRRATLAGNGEK